MGKWQKYGFLLVSLLLVAAALYFAFGTAPSGQEKKRIVVEKLPEMEFSGTKLSEVVDEKVNWELNSQTLIMDKEKNMVTFQKSQGFFYQEGKKVLTLQGEKGYLDLGSKDIQLEGHVQAFSLQGEQLQAEKIQWSAQKKMIQGEGKVVFIKGNTKVLGDRFQTDINLENIQVSGHVRVIIGGN